MLAKIWISGLEFRFKKKTLLQWKNMTKKYLGNICTEY